MTHESVGCGRFAPSPTGRLHLGNLRTAIAARSLVGRHSRFLIRMEDLDRVNSSRSTALLQLLDLAAVGVTSDETVIFQSDRFETYLTYVEKLRSRGLTFDCYCSRKDIQDAVMAPHGTVARYPGTCRNLTDVERRKRQSERPAAIRLRVDESVLVPDEIDEVVLVRNDGVPAYNLAVVVDDELQGVTQVVRGDDLRHITPSQIYLQSLLGFRKPEYVHLPLMVGPDGARLSKRHGDVTLADCLRLGFSTKAVSTALSRSLEVGSNGWTESSSLAQWLKSLL